MSQTGKVLHLYVEVRSSPEHDGKGSSCETTAEQDGPIEALTKLAQAAYGFPVPPSRSFKPNVNFRLQPSHSSLDSPQRCSIPQQEPFQQVPSGLNNNIDSKQLKHAHSSYSRQTSGPRTPCQTCSHHKTSKPELRQRSVVTFSYIEKAQIKTVKSPCNSPGGIKEVAACPLKRYSDPVWSQPVESSSNDSPFHQHMGSTLNPIGQAATQRALKEFGSPQLRCKFSNFSDWSPEIHQRQRERCQSWAGPPLPNCSAYHHDPDPGRVGAACGAHKSPASVAFLSQTVHNNQQKSTSRSQECPKQNLISKQDCSAPVNQSSGSWGEGRPLPEQRASLTETPTHGLNQLSGSNNSSALNSPEIARKIAEEATKVSTIFNEVRSSPPPVVFEGLSNLSSTNYQYPSREIQHETLQQSRVQHSAVKMNIPVREDHSTANGMHEAPATKSSDLRDDLTSTSFCSVPVGGDLDSVALPSRLLRPSLSKADVCSPLRDPRQLRVDLPVSDSPTLHRHKPPQYTGEEWTSGEPWFLDEDDWDDHVVAESVEISRRLFIGQSVDDSPVSWTSRQQWKEQAEKDEGKFSLSEKLEGNLNSSSPVYRKRDGVEVIERGEENVSNVLCGANHSPGESVVEMTRLTHQQRRAEWRRRQALLLGPVVLEEGDGEKGEDEQGFGDQQGLVGSSPSSSGVTGSLGDRDCISPESSQNSNQSDHPSSGIQSDGVSLVPGPSLHCQKTARAKWEFLFGTPAENTASKQEKNVPESSTAPSSGHTTPIPPSYLPLKELALRANHDVQHVEVELVTPPPAAPGTSPKTGIIRRTLKYSETDLDAIPLRCYRETDIDDVLLAEQEDADSAFGSNRSVMGTSCAGSSPLGEMPNERTDGQEEEEEEEEEEDVASWVTVRMQGDVRRLLAYQERDDEEEEFYRIMLKRPQGSFINEHTALKSPILVRGPRRRSRDSLDTFSRHFEYIMESHRAKGTSYSSLDSLDLLTSSTQTVLTFDLPTLTPQVQGQIYQSARQIVELSFAPLAQIEIPSLSESLLTITGDTDATRAPSSERLSSGSDDRNGQSWQSNPPLPLPREKSPRFTADPDLDQELTERLGLGLGSNDTLSNGNRANLDAAKRLAKRLFNLDGFRKCDVARHLSKNNDFSRLVAEEYLRYFSFTEMTLDQALRAFLLEFALTGETQERERILAHFSRQYVQCNSSLALSEDSVHTLTCALMLLNTDLHGHNIGKRMSCSQFIGNLEGLNSGHDFPKELLKALYNSIKNEKLQWTIDEEEMRQSFSELGEHRGESHSRGMRRTGSGLVSPSRALLYKTGFLVRKVHADCDGKRTPRGKRGWKTFYAVLKGLILYLQKGEYRPDKQLSHEDLKNAVSIHHSLAIRATDYSKRPNVFYLRTADWRVYLFQAPNAEQMQSWITRINTVAAMFSAPPLPAAIGSQKKFSRPLLPSSASKLTQEEQVQAHEAQFRSISSELVQLHSYPPDRKVKGRELEEYRLREEYLEFEKTRYETYSMLLRAKQRCEYDDLSVFEAMLLEEGALQRAQSSPTLQDSSLTCSTRDGASQSTAHGAQEPSGNGNNSCSRGQGQRHSYRQAVRK
ncbi:PH and SEC7 domain-containing protein 1-like [Carassius auratus]|uniref:PH and SEC7 domain-containing protein 1-like n=1 Tax=Carassius auratus TaxID=7957 RepID=A0A6P6N9U6_CARAU|nr:PH and SEC7 domain-containing protein 1-like [Carassius auratus]